MKKGNDLRLCSELLVDFLVSKKVKSVFDLSGGMIAYLEDAISRRKGIQCIPMHHEQAAGFAAEGYARKSQNFGVAMATSGPGATNFITAIGSCYFDSIPALFIVGQVHTDNLKKNNEVRQEGFQETNIVDMVRDITKYAIPLRDPEMILYELEKAFYVMKTGRQGPVLLDIPINLQRTEVSQRALKHFLGSFEHKQMEIKAKKSFLKKIEHTKVKKLEKLLHTAKSPLVLVGNGVRLSGSMKELGMFVKHNNLPVVASLLGLDAYPYTSNFIGLIGSNGNRDANIIFANSDLIIALGTRLDVRQIGDANLFNPNARIVHVDIDRSSIDYMMKSTLSFETNLSSFFKAVEHVRTSRKEKWEKFIRSVQEEFARPLVYKGKKIDPNTFLHELSLLASSTSTVLADVGQNQMWCAQSWRVKKGQRVMYSGGMGAMGFALPAAIGAWYADHTSNSIVICGDGGIQINIQELETVSRNKVPIKLFILNNKSLGMVREFQDFYFNKNYQSTVKGYGYPDFKKIAYAYGLSYARITSITKDDVSLKEILVTKKPVLIEVDIDMFAPLQPKVVFGRALDDQFPYLDKEKRKRLDYLKKELVSDFTEYI